MLILRKIMELPFLALAAVANTMPNCRCSADSGRWSFPHTNRLHRYGGNRTLTYRVCLTHGTERLYNMQEMRFLTKREVKTLVSAEANDGIVGACSITHI